MKMIVAIVATNLVTNLLLTFLCPFIKTKKRIKFSASWWCGKEK